MRELSSLAPTRSLAARAVSQREEGEEKDEEEQLQRNTRAAGVDRQRPHPNSVDSGSALHKLQLAHDWSDGRGKAPAPRVAGHLSIYYVGDPLIVGLVADAAAHGVGLFWLGCIAIGGFLPRRGGFGGARPGLSVQHWIARLLPAEAALEALAHWGFATPTNTPGTRGGCDARVEPSKPRPTRPRGREGFGARPELFNTRGRRCMFHARK